MFPRRRWACLLLLALPACAPKRAVEQPAAEPHQASAATAEQTSAPTAQRTSAVTDEFAGRRRQLVEVLRREGIRSQAVLDAIDRVPRHKFVPPNLVALAYNNHPLPIGHEQTISQPFVVAHMTEAADISPGERVLEIGTGSGYQAAVLANLAGDVYSIEIIPALAESAGQRLGELGFENIHVKSGNGYQGWAEHAPFDAIVVTAAPDHVPPALVEQLALQGKLVIPVGAGDQQMLVITKTASGIVEKQTIPVRFVPMTGQAAPSR